MSFQICSYKMYLSHNMQSHCLCLSCLTGQVSISGEATRYASTLKRQNKAYYCRFLSDCDSCSKRNIVDMHVHQLLMQ